MCTRPLIQAETGTRPESQGPRPRRDRDVGHFVRHETETRRSGSETRPRPRVRDVAAAKTLTETYHSLSGSYKLLYAVSLYIMVYRNHSAQQNTDQLNW